MIESAPGAHLETWVGPQVQREVRPMSRRALLLGVLLVAMAVIASGCAGSIVTPIVENPDVDAVRAVVDAFVVALKNQNSAQMQGLLASNVTSTHDIGWLGIRTGTVTKGDFASDWTNLWIGDGIDLGVAVGVVPKFSVVDALFTQGPTIAVTGSSAKATGKLLLTLSHPDSWFFDVRLDIERICTVEDIYPVELQLQKFGSSWRVTGFTVDMGERQSAMQGAWDTFVDGFAEGNTAKLLSVCQEPFYWTGHGQDNLIPYGTHYEWTPAFDTLFEQSAPVEIGFDTAVPMTLDAWSGALRGYFTFGNEYLTEITFGWHGDRWLLESIHVISSLTD